MKKIFVLFLIVVIALIGGVTSVASDTPKREKPNVPFVDKSETVGVSKIIIKIPYGTKVAKMSGSYVKEVEWQSSTVKNFEQFREVAERNLKNFGYNVIEEDLFQTSNSAKARFQIGGIVTKFYAVYDSQTGCMGPGTFRSKIDLNAEFQLYDSVKDTVVFKEAKPGYFENLKDWDDLEKLIVFAYEDALLRFMAEPQFVETLTGKKVQAENTDAKDRSPLRVGYAENAASLALPRDISRIFGGVVTIKAGVTHGSGVIVSEDGYILTAAHVVSGLMTVGVVLENGTQLEAQVVRYDRNNDSAIIKVDGQSFRGVSLNVNNPPIGSEVFVIGTPLDKMLSYTVTKGIVSGYRERDGVKYIQTDSAVNPGNSGGPMLDGNGNVIGIVSSKMVGSGVESIGFAIPIQQVLKSLNIVK